MCTQTQDHQSTPARSPARTSLAKVSATCVQDAHIEYIQDVLVFVTPFDHMLTGTDSLLVLGDFNAHHSLLHSGTTDTRGNQLADSISISSFAVLNTESPTRLPGNANPHFSRCIISIRISHLVRMANTQDHELRPSLSNYRQLSPHLLPGT